MAYTQRPLLTVLVGLPASGKTTLARKMVAASHGRTIRVNRDDLRAMMFAEKWSMKREELVSSTEEHAVIGALQMGCNVVVDSTNLSPQRQSEWARLATRVGADIKLTRPQANVQECVLRDHQRVPENRVGPAVIYNMALQYHLLHFEQDFVIFDIDGTLADIEDRRMTLLRDGSPDWKRFYNNMHTDQPLEPIAQVAREFVKAGRQVVLCSGRPAEYGIVTASWLERHRIKYDYLFMRATDDKRPDTVIKREIVERIPMSKCAAIFDDRPCVVKLWRDYRVEKGLRYLVIPVAGQCEEF